MALTLEKVLALDILKEAKVITKNHNLQIPVKGVNVMEAPDVADWIDGNEIIFTNLFSVHDDVEKMQALVRSLSKKQIAALIVKPKRFVSEIPLGMIEEAEKESLAIIEIPTTLRYMDIMYPVLAAVFDSQVIQLNYFKQTYHQLTTLALKKVGIQGIIDTIYAIVDNPVIFYDRDFHITHVSCDPIEPIGKTILDGKFSFDDLNYYRHRIYFSNDADKEYSQIIIPVKIFDFTRAYLSIIEMTHPLKELDFIALQNAVTVLCLELLSNITLAETERKYKLELIEDILMGRSSSSEALEERVKIIDWHLESPYGVLIAEFYNEENPPANDHIFNHVAADEYSDRIKVILEDTLKKKGLKGIIGNKSNKFVIFIENTTKREKVPSNPAIESSFQNQIEDVSRIALEKFKEEFSDRSLNIGFSSESGFLPAIPELNRSAQDALTIGKVLYGKNAYCNYEKLGVFKLLCSAHNRADLKVFVPESLQVLYDYEQKKPTRELLRTLVSFLENGYNANQTAKGLFIHYKTLHYRLHKIQQITGIDMKNNEELLEVQMGIKIMQVLGDIYSGITFKQM